jgi:hypothetical protein
MKTLVLEYDDLHFLQPEDCLDQITKFINLFPSIKISFFCPPFLRSVPLFKDSDWCSKIRKFIESGNVCLARHGLAHDQEEFKHLDFDDALFRLKIGDAVHAVAKLPYVKVFRGPHWGISSTSMEALLESGYTHLYNHQDYEKLGEQYKSQIKVEYYNWNLKDEAPDDSFLITHGHTHNVCSNGIEETFERVVSFIDTEKPEFKFVNEV